MQTVNIYVDTSIKGPRRRPGSYMYILTVQTNAGTADAGDKKRMDETTENQATLTAIETALKRMKKPSHIILWLECNYVAAAMQNEWYKQWKEKDWKTARGTPVADAEKWRSILYLLNGHSFEVRLKEQHTYREWMRRELEKEEQRKDGT